MRKIVLTFAAILVATCSYAQRSNFEWGVKAAVNLTSEWDVGDYSDGDINLGTTLGFLAEFRISDLLSIQPELVYSLQGSANYLKTGHKQTGYKSFVYHYLNLPVMFKFFVYQDKLSIDVGPQVGYLLYANEKRTPKKMIRRNKDMEDYDGVNRIENEFDVAGALGVSYKFAEKFDVYARYTMGFVKTLADDFNPSNNVTTEVNNKNYCIQVGVSARF